jgi:hypothetical protein
MEIAGSLLNDDDNQRLQGWRNVHVLSFGGFREDPELPPNWFRTDGDILCLSPTFFRQCLAGSSNASMDETKVAGAVEACLAYAVAFDSPALAAADFLALLKLSYWSDGELTEVHRRVIQRLGERCSQARFPPSSP